MTDVDNREGTIYIYCDAIGCEAQEIFDSDDGKPDFTTMSRDARAMGWKIFNKNGTWHHFCPKHQYKYDKHNT